MKKLERVGKLTESKKIQMIMDSVIKESVDSKEKILNAIKNSHPGTWYSEGTLIWMTDHELSEKGQIACAHGLMNAIEHEVSQGLHNIKSRISLNPDMAGHIDFTLDGKLIGKIETKPPIDYFKGSVPYPSSRETPGPIGYINFWVYLNQIDFNTLSDAATDDIINFINSMMHVERYFLIDHQY